MLDVLVSVIMPVYNGEEFLEKAFESLFSQTYRNIEVICIDDCSNDNSYALCEKYTKSNNIRLIRNAKNYGQEITRNKGLIAAQGTYIMFLDADDYLDKNCIESMVKEASRTDADLTIATYSKVINGIEQDKLLNIESRVYSKKEFSSLLLTDIPFDVLSCIGSKLYKNSFLKDNYITFNSKYKYNEDMGFALDTLMKVNKITFINKPFYKYLIRDDSSVMSSYRENMYISIVKVWEQIAELFKTEGIFQNKADTYYMYISYLMINSLINEIIYKEKDEFTKTAKFIRNHYLFQKVINCNKIGKKQFLILKLLDLKYYDICYYLLSMKKIKKRTEVA